MIMLTSPETKGQIVEVSYGWNEGHLYMLIYDRSDLSSAWYVADDEAANAILESWHYVNGAPALSEPKWTPCADPDRRSRAIAICGESSSIS